MSQNLRIAADIGGTFTDIALIRGDDTIATRKVASTPDDYARGVAEGILELIAVEDLLPGDIAEVMHARTVATNAILEGKGARTALITTEGFRDVLEMRRIRVPRLYDPLYEKPPALSPRKWRFEVAERMDFRGEVLTPLDEASVHTAIDAIAAAGWMRWRSACCIPMPIRRMNAASARFWPNGCRGSSSRCPSISCRKSANTNAPLPPSSIPSSARR